MKIRGLIDEDIVNYKKTAMYLAFPNCSFKCEKESGCKICQNASLVESKTIEITPEEICERYINNPLTSALVCAGLEPFDSRYDMLTIIEYLRRKYYCEDDVVIYTGYTEEELQDPNNVEINFIYKNLKNYNNIIIKFGRFVPGEEPHFDEVLGVNLASNNQYAKRLK